ncbi:lipopolysaccharide heptosyltransferase II [Helicobacter monodelphidis]|uniref:lipopolysaccharide heptosyltransferase II n=1 Tax=Helicobacter sp. 15-1451 TaxID=2004995 RepID=UPI000DCB90DB|nr:lipopolysaccharide heptosyltransferase II [Helicobacter sp. 15-1451]RAX58902.1 lipopolysaccharide heptosyltransferase II [Helicobacter sp. 15-1451]
MKILIRLPTWLGDTLMATPFLQFLKTKYTHADFTLVGSYISLEVLKRDFEGANFILDESKKSSFRLFALYKLAKQIGSHDISFSLQNNFLSALFLFFSNSNIRIGYANEGRSFLLTHALKNLKSAHQVQRYFHLLSPISDSLPPIPPLFLSHANTPPIFPNLKCVGINTGGAFGSAKRWSEEHFSTLAKLLLQEGYGVIFFGGKEDVEANQKIILSLKNNSNLLDLSGKTSLESLIDSIATLDLFISNDSGPMHIAAALQIPIIALFGSTDSTETSPWLTKKAILLSLNLPCSPCKKRICPLKHHACMENLKPEEVFKEVQKILQ